MEITEEILGTVLGLDGAEILAVKVGAALVGELLRHPAGDSADRAGVLSDTPGRLRLRLAEIKRAPTMAARVESRLRALPGVFEASANPTTGTVLVRYDDKAVSSRQVRLVAEHAFSALRVVPADDWSLEASAVA